VVNPMKTSILIAGMILTAQLAVYSQESKGQPSDQGLQIEVKEVAPIPDVHARYGLVKKIPKADYQSWRTEGEFHYGRITEKVPKDLAASLVELLVIVKNTGNNEVKFDNKNMKLIVSGGSVEPWEYLFPGLYDSYETLARNLGLSNERTPEQDSYFLKTSYNGNCYCPLKAGQQTWLDLIYKVPKNTINGRLSLGVSNPITVKIP